jgi:signal transduction histidine kinase
MIGYKCDELLARTLCDIIPDDMERDVFLSRVHDHNRVGDIEVRLLSQDGSDCWVLASAAKTGDNIVVCTVVDITGIRQAQECLSQANRKLNLLNNITRHDVLNQLTILSSYISLCRDAAHDQKLLELIAKQERAAETIRSQILFTRDYQNIGIHSPEWFNVAQTVTSAVASIDLSRIRFAIDLPQLQIYADPLLEKVFYNLIDNSVRHGEHVTAISVSCREVTGGLELIVQDDGAGIPEDGKEKIFRREYFKNTGLGLFLSREILGITGITISETGTPGQGARFVICVPRGSYRYQ